MQKRIEIRIAGLGGQGVVLAGEILGRAGVIDNKHVAQTQSYGAEARGSDAKSEVILSDEKIGFPVVRKCDILVAMSQNALDKHLKDLKDDGTLMIDETKVRRVSKIKARVFSVPATRTAETELKSKIYANVIMLGALAKVTGVVSGRAVEKAITESVSEKTKENNVYGFRIGLKLVAPA